jgi:hypothetical protein
VDIVLGVSMAPESVRMVLLEGRGADGIIVDEDDFDLGPESTADEAADQVIAAILGTRESAAENGHQLRSSGVTWTDPGEADAVRGALSAHKIENVMLVSGFEAAAALTQSVGSATHWTSAALLFVEPTTASLAIVDSSDGSVADVRQQALPADDAAVLAELVAMVSGIDKAADRPRFLFLVGSGVDVSAIKAALDASSSLSVTAPEEPETALARGAALASANASLGAPATSLLPKAPVERTDSGVGELAYSEAADADLRDTESDVGREYRSNRTFVVALSAIAAFVIGAVALVLGLALGIRPHVEERSSISKNVVAPASEAPAPKVVPAPPPPSAVPAPAPVSQAPAPVQQPAPIATPAEQPPSEAPPLDRPRERPWERRRLGRGFWP